MSNPDTNNTLEVNFRIPGRLTLDNAPDVLTVGEAARLARVGRNAMYGAVARGEIFSVRIGRSLRIPTIALRSYLGVDASPEERRQIAIAEKAWRDNTALAEEAERRERDG